MAIKKLTRFLLQVITVGIAAALVVVFLLPENGPDLRPVVEVRQSSPAQALPLRTESPPR